MQKHVNLVDLVKSFPTNIYLQNLASIQKRTIPVKFAHLAEKSGKGSISNLATKVLAGEESPGSPGPPVAPEARGPGREERPLGAGNRARGATAEELFPNWRLHPRASASAQTLPFLKFVSVVSLRVSAHSS